jgi:hypothetical protein
MINGWQIGPLERPRPFQPEGDPRMEECRQRTKGQGEVAGWHLTLTFPPRQNGL